jgi:hypothetical protein
MINKNKNNTFNVCYLREYLDPEHQGQFFYSYETVYRNVPVKYKSKFNDKTKLLLTMLMSVELNLSIRNNTINLTKMYSVMLLKQMIRRCGQITVNNMIDNH